MSSRSLLRTLVPTPYLVVVTPKKCGDIRITFKYEKLNKHSILGQLPIHSVDEVLDNLGTGRIFLLFDLISSFY